MIEVKNKRGISPIIATVLLIAISLSLAAIIFVWAYDFFGESIQKEGRAIESSCEDVRFSAEVDGENLIIANSGDVPLQGVEIKKRNLIGGDLIEIEEFDDKSIGVGETAEISLAGYSGLNGDLVISPVLMGEDETSIKKFVCDDNFGQVITV